MSVSELQAIAARLAKVSERLAALDGRIRRSWQRVPTAEEFRQQVAGGRREIEKRRTAASARWDDVKRIAEAKHVKLEGAALRNSVPDALRDDAEFLAARERALHDSRLVGVLEEKLINVMLTANVDEPASVQTAPPPESAIARERQNLAVAQKAVSAAVENLRRKATGAKVEVDLSLLYKAQTPETGVAMNRAVLEAIERARTQLRARDKSAEWLAELEFLRAVGPLEVNW